MTATSTITNGAAAAVIAIGLGAAAAQPSHAEEAECQSFSNISQWMMTMEASGRGASAELEGNEALSFMSATNRQPIAQGYSADKVTLFIAFRNTPTPHGMLAPGGALAVLFEGDCGTDVLMISPDVMAEIVKAARATPV